MTAWNIVRAAQPSTAEPGFPVGARRFELDPKWAAMGRCRTLACSDHLARRLAGALTDSLIGRAMRLVHLAHLVRRRAAA